MYLSPLPHTHAPSLSHLAAQVRNLILIHKGSRRSIEWIMNELRDSWTSLLMTTDAQLARRLLNE